MAPKKRKLEQQTKSKQKTEPVTPTSAPSTTNGAEDVLENSNAAEHVLENSNAAAISSTADANPVQGEPIVQEDAATTEGTQMEEDVPYKEEVTEGQDSIGEDPIVQEDAPYKEEVTEGQDSIGEDPIVQEDVAMPEGTQAEEDVRSKKRITEEGQESVAEDPAAPATAADNHAETVPGGPGDDDNEPETIHTLLSPLDKEQLLTLLTEAAEKHDDVMQSVLRVVDSDPAHRKIFVYGLGWDTDTEGLISAFQQYGEIEDCKAVKDKSSGKSKGYAFILFKHRSGAQKALKEPQKKIGNRMTSCQLASIGPFPQQPASVVSEYTQRKIYVSNVSAEIAPQELLQFFSKYGEIEEGPLGLDKHTGKPRGFALFVYKKAEGAKKALEEPHKVFEGHTIHCQKAIDGPKPNKPSWNQLARPSSVAARPGRSSSYASGMGSHIPPGPGHLMAPSQPMGQPLTTLLSNPAAGLGLPNLLGSLASPGMPGQVINHAAPTMLNNGGYGIQPGGIGRYGGQNMPQGGYVNTHGHGSGWGYRPGYKGGAPHLGR